MRRRLPFDRLLCVALGFCFVLSASLVRAQLPDSTEERLKMLADPEGLKKKLEKEKARPPLEFFRSQVAPFDVLPYIKPNHWTTLSIEMRANHDDYAGWLQSGAVPLLGMPQQVINRRDARLVKDQHSRLSLQLMLPAIPRELAFELLRPDSIRADDLWPAALKRLEPHQMLIVALTKESNEVYNPWRRLQALNPGNVDRTDVMAVDRQRYYQMVLPTEPEKIFLSPHPLTWTTISHIIWDAMPPDRLSVGQQQAMLDWLHWGGQLIVIGGAGVSYEILREGFLAPYLPAEPTGENALLKQGDLAPLSASYPPPAPWVDPNDPQPIPTNDEIALQRSSRYRAKEPIIPASNKPLYVAGLRPLHPSAVTLPLGEGSKHVLGVEERVGRGRILMLSINPTDPSLAAWPGLDTLIRRAILRRPEEPKVLDAGTDNRGAHHPAAFGMLGGPDLTWIRYLGRDLGADTARPLPYGITEKSESDSQATTETAIVKSEEENAMMKGRANLPVAEWVDSSTMPQLSQVLLKEASGITIPSSTFVLKVILAYLLALVPLNWVVCRYVFRRREWAWAVIPVLALGFAIGVERAAAYDIGYDLACDEIDLIESFNAYPRAHVSRFASLYSTGRVRFNISYPNDPTALVLPMISGSYLKGEEYTTSVWRSTPIPALEGFQVQPRSLGMFRAEQMANTPGSITLETGDGVREVVNDTEMELRDAVLVEINGPGNRQETYLGTIAPKGAVAVKSVAGKFPETVSAEGPNPASVLKQLREYTDAGPENSGAIRLVAWMPKPLGGQNIEPAPDRHRGFTAVVVHLRTGPPPLPDGPVYNALAGPVPRCARRRTEGDGSSCYADRPEETGDSAERAQTAQWNHGPERPTSPGRPR